MTSTRSWSRIQLAILTAGIFMMAACGGQESQEEVAEDMVKKTTGQNVNVERQGNKIEIGGKDAKTVIEKTSTWPEEMFQDVPAFTMGKIDRVVKSGQEGGMRKFNIYLVDFQENAVDTYADILKRNGWQTNVMQMGGKGGTLNAHKGTLDMIVAFSPEERRGTLMVHETPE